MKIIIKLIKQLINRWFKPKVKPKVDFYNTDSEVYPLNRHKRRYLAYRIREHTQSHQWMKCTYVPKNPDKQSLKHLSVLSGMTVEEILSYE